MKTNHAVLAVTPYGASELKRNMQKFSMWGICIASGIYFSLIGIYWITQSHETVIVLPTPRPTQYRIIDHEVFVPPPPIKDWIVPKSNPAGGGNMIKSTLAYPVPVEDHLVNPEDVFVSQKDTYQGGYSGDGTGDGYGVYVPDTVDVETEPGPFTPWEKEPVLIKKVDPFYPEVARQVGLMGNVVVNLWVDKKGHVRDVRVIKSTSELFNQAVIDAAEQYVFVPAMMNNGPVSVWIAVPFSFELK